MKKNFLFSLMALFVVLFASCSQEEIVSTTTSPQGNGLVTVSVNMPQEKVASRTMPSIEGYIRRCIMQVVDSEGTAIEGDDMRQVKEVTGETVSFSFTAPEVEYNVLFWADYVNEDINKDYLYNTTDNGLTNITMKMNRYHMFQEYADAFCGSIKGGETSATLKRPFSLLTIKVEDVTNYANFDQISIGEFTVPDGYNVFNKTTATTKAISLVTADDKAPVDMVDAEGGVWAYVYVFAPVDATSQELSLPITLHSSTGAAEDVTFKATSTFTWDENTIINFPIPAEVPEEGETIEIEVDFGEDYENEPVDPNAPLAVGDYINANGEKVATAEEAIAVVFALAGEQTDASSYTGTVEAYAVSLTKAAGRAYLSAEGDTWTPVLVATTTTDTDSPYSGYQLSSDMMTAVGDFESRLFTAYTTWLGSSNSVSNSSGWYIPSYAQLQDILALDNDALKAGLNAAYTGAYFLISSSINEDLTIKGSTYDPTTGEVTRADQAINPASHQGMIFPVVTIFE